MKSGDLVEISGLYEANQQDRDPIIGVLMGYNQIEEGWDIAIGDRVECFPRSWWKIEKVDLKKSYEEQ